MTWLRALAQRAGWSAKEIARATAENGEALPCIEFAAEAEQCPVCTSEVQIRKSKSRTVLTFEAGTAGGVGF